jgi:uncharacterized protein (TIGR03086 family)
MDQTALPLTDAPLAAIEQACASTDRFVAGVTADQFGLPTPCTEWDVRALLNHLLGVLALHRGLLTDQPPAVNMVPGGLPDVDLVGSDPIGAYRAGVAAVLQATDADSLAKPHDTPLGAMPGALLCGFSTLDILVHGWDLARATGQGPTLDANLAEQVLGFARQTITDDTRAPHIQPQVPVAVGASATDRLVAYMGRRA